LSSKIVTATIVELATVLYPVAESVIMALLKLHSHLVWWVIRLFVVNAGSSNRELTVISW